MDKHSSQGRMLEEFEYQSSKKLPENYYRTRAEREEINSSKTFIISQEP